MNAKLAVKIMLLILLPVLVFHMLVLTGIISYKNVWGGRIHGKREMYVFETVSILLNAWLLFIILQKAKMIKPVVPLKVQQVSLWIFVIVFSLNTIGNILADNLLEKTAGTLLTLISAVLCWVIAGSKQ